MRGRASPLTAFLKTVNYGFGSSAEKHAIDAVTVRHMFAFQLPSAESADNNFRLKLFDAWVSDEFLEFHGVHGFSAADN